MYERGDFAESIHAAGQKALTRLFELKEDNFKGMVDADVAVERIESVDDDNGYPRLNVSSELFTSVFDRIHDELMHEASAPEYITDIISGLVRVGVEAREQNAGNSDITQLIPDANALREHVQKIWHIREIERLCKMPFDVYRFHKGHNIVQIIFKYDEQQAEWKLGYAIEAKRMIVCVGRGFYEQTEDGILHLDPINEGTFNESRNI
jgi:hypothetical protein